MSCLWAFPEVAGAKHAGITRHYKFNVRVYTHTHFAHANTQLSI
jgi:laccase